MTPRSSALDAMIKAYPDHRRVSWAHNLAGRALLDKGQPRAAAEALLANYRRDPKGERAQDSLFYLGQALMKLGQPGQACKAYAELEDVYGATLRARAAQAICPPPRPRRSAAELQLIAGGRSDSTPLRRRPRCAGRAR